MPELFIIAGPNGAGKTTAAKELLPKHLGITEFVNADEIARGLNPLKPETADIMAGRVLLERFQYLIKNKKSFGFESTLAGRNLLRLFKQCQDKDYFITLIFLWLPSADLAVERVKDRVKQGGHHVPEKTIRRRYHTGLNNLFHLYWNECDVIDVRDNSRSPVQGQEPPRIMYKNSDIVVHSGKNLELVDYFNQIRKGVKR